MFDITLLDLEFLVLKDESIYLGIVTEQSQSGWSWLGRIQGPLFFCASFIFGIIIFYSWS